MASENLEVWMRGPVAEVHPLLQPVAHVLLQIEEDIPKVITEAYAPYMWEKPYGMASIAFHLNHIAGVIDRMFTYAAEQPLNEAQFAFLATEGTDSGQSLLQVQENLAHQIQNALQNLTYIDAATLTDTRFLGRKKIPTTQIGLLFHAAEHAMRHYGQLLVTAKVIAGLFLQTEE